MNYNIALLKGDGIGPEIVDSAVAVLKKIGEKYSHTFNFSEYLMGGCAYDATGNPLPEETVKGLSCKRQCNFGCGRQDLSGILCRVICARTRTAGNSCGAGTLY